MADADTVTGKVRANLYLYERLGLSHARLPNRDHLCAGLNMRLHVVTIERSQIIIDRLCLRFMSESHAWKSFAKRQST